MFLLTEGRIQDGPVRLNTDQQEFVYRMLTPSTTYFLVIDAVYNNRIGAPVPLKVTTAAEDESEPVEGITRSTSIKLHLV